MEKQCVEEGNHTDNLVRENEPPLYMREGGGREEQKVRERERGRNSREKREGGKNSRR